jgi:hypothetical protein
MNRCLSLRPWAAFVVMATLWAAAATALAAPGAHGPDGEHLDDNKAAAAWSGAPRVEAKSEQFELVAELRARELAILVDRYETNEPVLGAKLDVESGPLKAVAAFRAESGDYVVADAALLKALAAPGEHPLVFTLVAGKESDLLDATLAIAAAPGGGAQVHSHVGAAPHSHAVVSPRRIAWIGAVLAVLVLVAAVAWWRGRGKKKEIVL